MLLSDYENLLTEFNNVDCYIRVVRGVGKQPRVENVNRDLPVVRKETLEQ